jgi:hypothetical protein
MGDIIFVLIAVAFFAVCVAYVRACDRLVRRSEETADSPVVMDSARGGDVLEVGR